jgi:hypothetical protein
MNRELDRLFNSRVDLEMSFSIMFILFMVRAGTASQHPIYAYKKKSSVDSLP